MGERNQENQEMKRRRGPAQNIPEAIFLVPSGRHWNELIRQGILPGRNIPVRTCGRWYMATDLRLVGVIVKGPPEGDLVLIRTPKG